MGLHLLPVIYILFPTVSRLRSNEEIKKIKKATYEESLFSKSPLNYNVVWGNRRFCSRTSLKVSGHGALSFSAKWCMSKLKKKKKRDVMIWTWPTVRELHCLIRHSQQCLRHRTLTREQVLTAVGIFHTYFNILLKDTVTDRDPAPQAPP